MKKTIQPQPDWQCTSSTASPGGAEFRPAASDVPTLRKTIAGRLQLLTAVAALTSVVGLTPAIGGDKTWDFTTDPVADGLIINGTYTPDQNWNNTGQGNPGGFLAVTYSQNTSTTLVVFPDIDPGKVVTGFTFTCDLRVGNPQSGDRPADGFSVSFARAGDPFLADPTVDTGLAGNCCAETGTKTGIAISFDTWAGNVFPGDPNDTTDIEGIIVRVDNVTVKKQSLPTRNGACDDVTSLQTGPRNTAYWTGGGDPLDPAAWAGLCWKPFKIDLTTDGKLTVEYKGNKVLDAFQTSYFPTAGQLVMAGRTGNANEATHVDNIHLVTVATDAGGIPGAVPNFHTTAVGAGYVSLSWDAAVVAGDPTAKVAYEILRDGVSIVPFTTTLTYTDKGVGPNKDYVYKIHALNIANQAGPDATVNAHTLDVTDGVAFLQAEQWTGITGTAVAGGTADDHYLNDPPDRIRYVNGFSFGETTGFGDTWGDNHLVRIRGVFTAPKTGDFRFFVRSDDASQLYVNTSGPALPDESGTLAAEETGCCTGFFEPPNEQVSEPIHLTAGSKYGIAYFVKEGGGGDWGQVAIREEGDTTPAGNLTPLRGSVLAGKVDTAGASVTITKDPVDAHVAANDPVTFVAEATGTSPYGADYGNVISYQWYLGGNAVLNANSATWTQQYAKASDTGKKVWVVAAVAGANVKSAEATLTVDADTTAPAVKRIGGSDSFASATVTWKEPVVDPSAIDPTKYQIAGLAVSAATRVNATTILLTTATQTPDTDYNVTINGVLDNAGLASAVSTKFHSFVFKTGIAAQSDWLNESGAFGTFDNGDGTGAKFRPPDQSAIVTDFGGNDGDQYDNYFRQTKALFVPATTGDYVFWMASDDHGELYLSEDATEAKKHMIAQEPSWSGRRHYNTDTGGGQNDDTRGAEGARANRSDEFGSTEWPGQNTIHLTGNTKYYIELLYKEGGGGDHGSATFTLAGAANPADGNRGTLTGDRIGWYYDPSVQPPTIVTRPGPQLFSAGDKIEFKVVAQSATPITGYQWYHNKHAIAGATSDTLTINNAGVADIGDYYVDVTNDNGTVSSFPDNDSRASMKGAFVVEVEDYNYDGGKTLPAASTMPITDTEMYKGKDGLPGIDFHLVADSGGTAGNNGNSLRNGWLDDDGTTVHDFPTAPEALGNPDVIIDDGGGGPGAQNRERPDFVLTHNYKIGWGGAGEWYQFTRDFAPGTYSAVGLISRDGRTADAYGTELELVTGDPHLQNAAATPIGSFVASGTGSWSSVDSIPFLTPGGNTLATFTLGAATTVRWTIMQGDPDLDALLFYKSGGGGGKPAFTSITFNPATGKVKVEWTGNAKLQASPTVISPTWQDVPGATSSPFEFTPDPNVPTLFGRLQGL